jgi:hypothetical protein
MFNKSNLELLLFYLYVRLPPQYGHHDPSHLINISHIAFELIFCTTTYAHYRIDVHRQVHDYVDELQIIIFAPLFFAIIGA